jgi:ribonuclease BN (tRNA processing enzyme)
MGLSVTVLGCSGSYPGRDGACSGYLVRNTTASGTTTIWMDCGSGTMANLQRHADLDAVDAVVVTHEHPDHWTDLESFHVWAKYGPGQCGIPVYAPGSFRTLTPRTALAPTFDWRVVADADRVDIGDIAASFSRTDHGPETLAVRLNGGGRSLGYSADSGPGWSLEALGPGLDLALCEATLLSDREGRVPGHLSARQAGATAAAAGVGKLALTHLWPTVDPTAAAIEARTTYDGPLTEARLHDTYEV